MQSLNLKELRAKYKLTKPQIAKQLGCSLAMYSNYELGHYEMPDHRKQFLEYKVEDWNKNLCQCGHVLNLE